MEDPMEEPNGRSQRKIQWKIRKEDPTETSQLKIPLEDPNG
jgi:hypothetical protein